jgi:hypothetical protein
MEFSQKNLSKISSDGTCAMKLECIARKSHCEVNDQTVVMMRNRYAGGTRDGAIVPYAMIVRDAPIMARDMQVLMLWSHGVRVE